MAESSNTDKPGTTTEAQYLQRQADDASKAMGKTLDEARQRLMKGLNVHAVAKDHPWATVAAGAVAGFATGAVITPNKRDAALKRLAEIERALHPVPPHATTAAYADGNGHAAGHGKMASILTTVLGSAFTMIKPLLLHSLTATMAAHTAANEAAETTQEMNNAESESA
ncbi:MAG TPA: hypothetical protein VGN72_21880 [Tepidisphaeraceae bacterium]|jgi:ElaB/YqjD/DUF883 family membrane-anchored ribosome-binding protein|nr:hypothetical protein [Tepidisphaeraceae bacterium]